MTATKDQNLVHATKPQLLAFVQGIIGYPIDTYAIVAVLETYGLRDVDARERFGAENVFLRDRDAGERTGLSRSDHLVGRLRLRQTHRFVDGDKGIVLRVGLLNALQKFGGQFGAGNFFSGELNRELFKAGVKHGCAKIREK